MNGCYLGRVTGILWAHCLIHRRSGDNIYRSINDPTVLVLETKIKTI